MCALSNIAHVEVQWLIDLIDGKIRKRAEMKAIARIQSMLLQICEGFIYVALSRRTLNGFGGPSDYALAISCTLSRALALLVDFRDRAPFKCLLAIERLGCGLFRGRSLRLRFDRNLPEFRRAVIVAVLNLGYKRRRKAYGYNSRFVVGVLLMMRFGQATFVQLNLVFNITGRRRALGYIRTP
jgi:hypothetical protein